jgi:nitrate reductase gamma subunit
MSDMSAATVLFALAFYAAAALLAGGLAWKIRDYARTPAPLRIPTTPAPTSRGGVALRMLREVALFESLFKANIWLWSFGWLFHMALLLALLRHLRYFTEPVWTWVAWIQPFGVYAGMAMVAALGGLWARRLWVPAVRHVTTPSDHLMVALLLAIGLSGLSIKYLHPTDIVAVKAFFLGLVAFEWQPLPAHAGLYVHLALVVLLMAVFPFSKLLHAPAVFFSPTRNQTDDAREKRHVAPWAARLEH